MQMALHIRATGLHRLAAMLALAGLVFHGLLPLTQNAIQRVQAANGIEQVVLCSALGFRTVTLKDGMPVDAPEKPQKVSQNCPACHLGQLLSQAILPVGLLLALPALSLTVLYGAAAGSTAAQSVALPPQARAPPFSL